MTTPELTKAHTTEHGTLYHGDCLDLMAEMPDESCDLVFADPPFNLNKDYGRGVRDDLKEAEYLDWCSKWVAECARVVAPGGAFWTYNLPKWNIPIGNMLHDAGLMFRHWVAVDIKTLLPIQGRLYPAHYSLLYYTRGKPKFFERPRIPIATCRHCGGDRKPCAWPIETRARADAPHSSSPVAGRRKRRAAIRARACRKSGGALGFAEGRSRS